MAKRSDYTIEDWWEYRKFFGLKTVDLSKTTGLAEQSIRGVTSASYVRKHGLPTWVVTAIMTWKRMQEADMSREADLRNKMNELINSK